ncbi:hypothetical protein NDU88_005198 [Pleurodeles waltl]|uniref:Uncharacterized protein n=1 Tax=Pleurodeles waltl TaxID=8319 RepID=A0AAV7TUR8_PLEWA|nr:hypothetical protein NDU88_005198 [Pleurodeles waltl]
MELDAGTRSVGYEFARGEESAVSGAGHPIWGPMSAEPGRGSPQPVGPWLDMLGASAPRPPAIGNRSDIRVWGLRSLVPIRSVLHSLMLRQQRELTSSERMADMLTRAREEERKE